MCTYVTVHSVESGPPHCITTALCIALQLSGARVRDVEKCEIRLAFVVERVPAPGPGGYQRKSLTLDYGESAQGTS